VKRLCISIWTKTISLKLERSNWTGMTLLFRVGLTNNVASRISHRLYCWSFAAKRLPTFIEKRGIQLHELLRFKYQLAKAVQQKIDSYRRQAYASDYQKFLFSPDASIETGFTDGFAFENLLYPVAWPYAGRYQFKKHFFGKIGELKSDGEEFDWAQTIDNHPDVKYWIRNLSGHKKSSFWLSTSTDRFYPDFVVQLYDDRIMVVEYQGADRVSADDTKEKRNIGELWAAKSNGKGIFLLPKRKPLKD